MATPTTRPPAEAEAPPLDVETIRKTARRLLTDDADPLTPEAPTPLAVLLRDHIRQLNPEAKAAIPGLPQDDVPKMCAQACLGETQMRLRLGNGDTAAVRPAVTTKPARSVNALYNHRVNLGGQRATASTSAVPARN
ncbi:DUF6415 family natural product biosynthesis protein [Streptomyces cyaneochromogenes]|uniref:DUF6415 family natural product biosynthesis protein n=1 Tax=Streptomyces cyaneochromogenes TaxID=2496836 RepID=UPI0015886EAB|nr:DUF6415 family natural product biosynthesis protein [Streptomyces cyaneochromogenes]